jgi:hypothetical protein
LKYFWKSTSAGGFGDLSAAGRPLELFRGADRVAGLAFADISLPVEWPLGGRPLRESFPPLPNLRPLEIADAPLLRDEIRAISLLLPKNGF